MELNLINKILADTAYVRMGGREEEKKADFIAEILSQCNLSPRRKGNNIWCLSRNWSPTQVWTP